MSDEEIQKDRLRGFLDGLTKLREDFGMEVGGCGDCGSAWVYDLLTVDFVGQELVWSDERSEWQFRQGSILHPMSDDSPSPSQ